MSTPNPNPHILIIGGGLTGLSLGQGLKRAGIPFTIYERDTSASFRAQGYRIRIGPDGAGALKYLLPDDLWEIFQNTCARVASGFHRLDANTAKEAEWKRGPPPKHGGNQSKWALSDDHIYNADRTVLRRVLLSGLEDFVQFGKRFERYEVRETGEVVAHFDDGTNATGSFLVGADGIRSLVRRQLLPKFQVLDTEGRAVFGKTVLNDELIKRAAPQISDGISLSGPGEESRIKLFCDDMRWDRETAGRAAQKMGMELPTDYIYWVLLFRADIVGEEQERTLLHLSNEQSAKITVELTSGWNEQLRVLFDMQNVDAASTLTFLTAPLEFESEWATIPVEFRARVTVIGDGAHPMPPVGGVGANAGFQDSAELFDMLCKRKKSPDGQDGHQMILEFEQGMLGRAKALVARSSGGAGLFFGMRPLAELKTIKV